MNNPIYYIYGNRLNFPSVSGNFVPTGHDTEIRKFAEQYYPDSGMFGYDPTNQSFNDSKIFSDVNRPIIFNIK